MRPVAFGVPAEVAFDFLVDPRNRPVWQSSLRRVEEVAGDPHVGQTWVDVTSPGLRPEMRTTVLDRPSCWAEQGRWRGVAATLTLRFVPAATGCEVTAEVTVTGRGPVRVLGPVLEWAARRAVPADLERAARILSERSP